jgi:hypothetical protein
MPHIRDPRLGPKVVDGFRAANYTEYNFEERETA